MGWHPCCCAGHPCAGCNHAVMPEEVEVVLTGLANAGCGTCATFNTSFILPVDPFGAAINSYCVYADIFNLCGQDWQISFVMSSSALLTGAPYQARVHIDTVPASGVLAYWYLDFASKPDCEDLDGIVLPNHVSGLFFPFPCDLTLSSCTVNFH